MPIPGGMSLAFKPFFSERPTYTAPYLAVGTELRPKKPKKCIFCIDPASRCHITSKGKRQRKVGIEYPLLIFRCRTHFVCFPVYPLGWSQYGRRPLVDLAPDGSEFDSDVNADSIEVDGERADGGDVDIWQETAFGAAIEAAHGHRWPLTAFGVLRTDAPRPYGVFATQRRHIAGVVRLFRLDTESGDKDLELVAARLPVGFSALKSSAAKIRDGPTQDRWQREGSEGRTITQRLTPPRCWLKHLLELGAAVNFWGSPMYG